MKPDTREPDHDWAVAKLRMEFAYRECLAGPNPLSGLAGAISTIYAYGEQTPEARPHLISLTGADR